MELNNNQTVLLALYRINPRMVFASELQVDLPGRKASLTLNNLKQQELTKSEPVKGKLAHRWGLTMTGLAAAQDLDGRVNAECPGPAPEMPHDSAPSTEVVMVQTTPTPRGTGEALAQVLEHMARQIVEGILSHLMAGLQDRVRAQLEAEFEQALKTLPERVLASLPAIPEPSRPAAAPKKRVTIVGLLNGQVDMMRREFGKELDLHFVEVAKDAGRLKSLSGTSHAVLTMTGFIRHADEELIKAAGGNLIRVTGGMSTLRDKLTEIYIN